MRTHPMSHIVIDIKEYAGFRPYRTADPFDFRSKRTSCGGYASERWQISAGLRSSVGTVLALFAAYVIYGFRMMTPLPNLTLEPHYVLILPHWWEILADLQLITTAADYDELYKSFNSLPPEQYNVFRNGFCYSVLEHASLGPRTLVHELIARHWPGTPSVKDGGS
jgi:hypothetical protein